MLASAGADEEDVHGSERAAMPMRRRGV
jgi:hypothetical protein